MRVLILLWLLFAVASCGSDSASSNASAPKQETSESVTETVPEVEIEETTPGAEFFDESFEAFDGSSNDFVSILGGNEDLVYYSRAKARTGDGSLLFTDVGDFEFEMPASYGRKIPVIPGELYNASIYYYAEQVPGMGVYNADDFSIRIQIRFFTEGGIALPLDSSAWTVGSITGESYIDNWVHLSNYMTAPMEATNATVAFVLYDETNDHRIYFDDISFQHISFE